MSLFGRKEKKQLAIALKRVHQLEALCSIKDQLFLKSISDGLRHGSPQAARYMADRKKYLKGK